MKKRTLSASAILFAAILAPSAHAVTEYWDPAAGANLGGPGTWDLTTPAWSLTGAATASTTTWTNGNDAVFSGTSTTPATVTLANNISANSLTFSNTPTTAAYTLTGTGTTLTFGTLIFPLISPTPAAVTANLNVSIGGGDINIVNNNTTNVAQIVSFGAAANSFTGNINLSGAVPTGTVTSGWRLQLNLSNATPGAIPSTAAFNFNRTFSQISFSAPANTDYGTLTNPFHLNNNNLAGAFNSDIGAVGNVTLAGLISGLSDLFVGAGTSGGQGVITLTNQNTYTGTTRIITINTGGVLRLGVDNALPSTTDLVFGSTGTLATPSGAVDLNGHNQSVASIGNLAGQTGLQNGITNTSATTSTLTIRGGTNSTYAGPIGLAPNLTNLATSNDNIALLLDTANRGTLSLAGTTTFSSGTTIGGYAGTTYSKGTVINGGTLAAANTTGSATGTGPVTVGPQGTLASGFYANTTVAGTIAGAVTSSGYISPGLNSTTAGTLTLSGGLTANAGSHLVFDITAVGNDKLALAGATPLALPATPQSVNLNLLDRNSSITNGSSYTLITYPANSLTLDTSASGPLKIVRPTSGLASLATFTLNNNPAAGTLSVTASGTFGRAGVSWRGDATGAGAWDTVTPNFNVGTYANPDDVTIDQSVTNGAATDPINVTVDPAGVYPANLTVTNTTRTVTISGGPIQNGSVTKTGTGTLILSGANSYAGGTFVNAGGGTVAITSDASLGAVPAIPSVNVTLAKTSAGGTTLRFDADLTLNANRNILLTTNNGGANTFDTNTHNVTIAGQIIASASMNIAKSGLGTLTLAGDNSTSLGGAYLNIIQINAGTLSAAQDINLGKIGNGVNFTGSGGTFRFDGSFDARNRPWSIAQPATFDTNGFNSTLSGIVSGTAVLTKTGSGTLTLSGANTLTNATVVKGGTLLLKPAAFIPLTNAGGVTLNAGKLLLDSTGTTLPLDVRATLKSIHAVSPTFTDATQRFRTTNTPDANKGIGYYQDGNITTLAYTYLGDANLNGVIDPDDYALLDSGYAKQAAPSWVTGDFNYDDHVDSNDYLLIDTSFAAQGGTFSPAFLASRESEFGAAYVSTLLAAVPEPTSLVACGFAIPALLRRRRP